MVAKTKIMYAKALAYRQKMNNLSEDDIRRPLYEKMIVEILDAAQFISNSVTRMAGSGHWKLENFPAKSVIAFSKI